MYVYVGPRTHMHSLMRCDICCHLHCNAFEKRTIAPRRSQKAPHDPKAQLTGARASHTRLLRIKFHDPARTRNWKKQITRVPLHCKMQTHMRLCMHIRNISMSLSIHMYMYVCGSYDTHACFDAMGYLLASSLRHF